jgi:hypothetical protein
MRAHFWLGYRSSRVSRARTLHASLIWQIRLVLTRSSKHIFQHVRLSVFGYYCINRKIRSIDVFKSMGAFSFWTLSRRTIMACPTWSGSRFICPTWSGSRFIVTQHTTSSVPTHKLFIKPLKNIKWCICNVRRSPEYIMIQIQAEVIRLELFLSDASFS